MEWIEEQVIICSERRIRVTAVLPGNAGILVALVRPAGLKGAGSGPGAAFREVYGQTPL